LCRRDIDYLTISTRGGGVGRTLSRGVTNQSEKGLGGNHKKR